MNKFLNSVQCPECKGYGYIKINKQDMVENIYYTSFKQCTKCCGFGTILVKDDNIETEE